ncbi:MAG: hypothetical protein RL399_111 [Actinomycetota bacterium]
MANKSAPIKEVSRLLDLVPFLSTHSHISLKELASEFGVSEKEMASELTALSMCGLPGYTPYELIEIFFETGYVTINNHETLDIPRALTRLEVASLLIGLEILKDRAEEDGQEFVGKIGSLITQLKALIGEAIDIEDAPQSAFIPTIESAIASRKSLLLEYQSPVRDEVSLREVDPLHLEVDNSQTYLNAYCHSAGEMRKFRLDRVHSIKQGQAKSELPERGAESEEPSLEVLMKVSGSRRQVAELFSIDSIGKDGKVTTQVYSSEWLIRAVLASAPAITLIEPREIRESIALKAEKILALYSS